MFVKILAQVDLPDLMDHMDEDGRVGQEYAEALQLHLNGLEFWSYRNSIESAQVITAKVEVVK